MDSNYHNVAMKGFMIDIVDREWVMDVLPNDDVTILPNGSMEQSKNPIQDTLSQLTNNHPSLASHPLFIEEGVTLADMKDNSMLGDTTMIVGSRPSDFGQVNEWNDLNLFSLAKEEDDFEI